eukprot:g30070.t1
MSDLLFPPQSDFLWLCNMATVLSLSWLTLFGCVEAMTKDPLLHPPDLSCEELGGLGSLATANDTCVLELFVLSFRTSSVISGPGHLILLFSSLTMDPSCAAHASDANSLMRCNLTIHVGELSLHASHLKAAIITLEADRNITISRDSVVSSFMALEGGRPSMLPTQDGKGAGGGGHGGNGGIGCPSLQKAECGYGAGSIMMPKLMGGTGGSPAGGVGGGVIWVTAGEALLLDGWIRSDGGPAISNEPSGGGAGGSVYLLVRGLLQGTGNISAIGGQGDTKGLGGGGAGGRIHIANSAESVNRSLTVRVHGGGLTNAANGDICELGGSGTFFYEQLTNTANSSRSNEDTNNTLHCLGPLETNVYIAPTIFEFTSLQPIPRCSLSLDLCVFIIPTGVVLSNFSNITVSRNSRIYTDRYPSGALCIVTGSFRVSKSNLIAYDINITTGSFFVDSLSLIKVTLKLSIHAEGAVEIANQIVDSEDSFGNTKISINAKSITLSGSGSELRAGFVYLHASTLEINGNVLATWVPPNCSQAFGPEHVNCTSTPSPASNVSLWTRANEVTVNSAGRLEGAVLVVCANEMNVLGSLSSTAAGCPSMQGLGAGGVGEEDNTASGGGHGGPGGNSSTGFAGGPAYDNEFGVAPRRMGSGGGSADGGVGGGLIILDVNGTFYLGNAIEANGQTFGSSNEAGGGGGSGGAISISTTNLYCVTGRTCVLNASGGNGAAPGGGGGGGGVIFVEWKGGVINPSNLSTRMPVVEASGGLAGNRSAAAAVGPWNATAGSPGVLDSEPTCEAGWGGLFCTPCLVGYFKASIGNMRCEPCSAGNFSNRSSSLFCNLCLGGTFSSQASSSCSRCPAGRYSHSGANTCSQCLQGTYSLEQSGSCQPCSQGNYQTQVGSSSCNQCGLGSSSYTMASSCFACQGKPSNSMYNQAGSCGWVCEAAFLDNDKGQCVTPWLNAVNKLGGFGPSAGLFGGVVMLLACPFLACWFRRKRQRSRQRQWLKQELKMLNYVPGSPFVPSANENSMQRNASWVRVRAQDADDPVLGNRLSLADLSVHLHRIYFSGSNHFDSPLSLRPVPDSEINSVVDATLFAEFTHSVFLSHGWRAWESRLVSILSCIYLPLAHIFIQRRREHHLKLLFQYLRSYNHDFIQDTRSRALGNSLKFGASPCHTLCWIDVLAFGDVNDSEQELVGKPCIPMALVVAGDGRWYSPFGLDLTDSLNKSLVIFYGHHWFRIMCHLNALLRTLRQDELYSPSSMQPILKYLDDVNCQPFIQRTDSGPGVVLELGYMDPSLGGVPLSALKRLRKRSKLCILVLPEPVSHRTDMRSHPSGSSSLEILRPHDILASDSRATNLLSMGDYRDSSARTSKNSSVRQPSEQFPEPKTSDSHIQLNTDRLPYGAIPTQWVLDGLVAPPSAQRVVLPSLLRRSLAPAYPLFVGFTLASLLLLYAIILVSLFLTTALVENTLLSVLAYACLCLMALVPIFGYAALVFDNSSFMRFFCAANVFTLFPACVLLVCNLISWPTLGFWLGFDLPVAAALVHLCMAWISRRYLAFLEYKAEEQACKRDFLRAKLEHKLDIDSDSESQLATGFVSDSFRPQGPKLNEQSINSPP